MEPSKPNTTVCTLCLGARMVPMFVGALHAIASRPCPHCFGRGVQVGKP